MSCQHFGKSTFKQYIIQDYRVCVFLSLCMCILLQVQFCYHKIIIHLVSFSGKSIPRHPDNKQIHTHTPIRWDILQQQEFMMNTSFWATASFYGLQFQSYSPSMTCWVLFVKYQIKNRTSNIYIQTLNQQQPYIVLHSERWKKNSLESNTIYIRSFELLNCIC